MSKPKGKDKKNDTTSL